MTSSTPTNEGNAIAGNLLAQAKGDIHAARRVAGEAHAALTKFAAAIDPSFKSDDKDARIVELETQLRDAQANEGDDAAQARIVELTSANADLGERLDRTQATLDEVRTERSNFSRSVKALGDRVVATERERDEARAELARVMAELAEVRARNFDAPRSIGNVPQAHSFTPEALPAVQPEPAQVVEVVAPVVVESPKPAAPALAPVASNDDKPQRPATISEGAWASMSPMMQKFAAARAAAVK